MLKKTIMSTAVDVSDLRVTLFLSDGCSKFNALKPFTGDHDYNRVSNPC